MEIKERDQIVQGLGSAMFRSMNGEEILLVY